MITMSISLSLLPGNILKNVQDWKMALQIMSTTNSDHMTSHVTSSDITTEKQNDRMTGDTITVEDHMNSHMTSNDIIVKGHMTSDDITGVELTWSTLLYLMVNALGPALSAGVMGSVGVANPEKGAELHSLMVQLAAVQTQQRYIVSRGGRFGRRP